jgi:hypothetical protein
MGAKDLKSNIKMGVSIAQAAKTSTATGTGFDVSGSHGACAVIDAGAWTDGTHAFTVQESDDNSTYTDVSATNLDGTAPTISGTSGQSQQYYLGYKGNKKYIRVKSTVSGTTTGAIYGAYILYGFPKDIPAN